MSECAPLRGPEAAGAEEVSDGARGGKLGVTGVKHHAEIFGDHCGLSAVLHLVKQYKSDSIYMGVKCLNIYHFE